MIILLLNLALANDFCKDKDPNLQQLKAVSNKIEEQQLVAIDQNYPWLITTKTDAKRWKIKLSKP